MNMKTPNILLIVSDQERQRDWLPAGLDLPARQRLLDEGLEFTNYYTHTSPCSPSRATLFTGQYMLQHGVLENSTGPENTNLPTSTATLGHMLRNAGYKTGYKGKWHLQNQRYPEMEKFGFGDWEGNDSAWWGLPGTGTEFDEPITDQTITWLKENATSDKPWFLTTAFVNPHDIMWFPCDQPWWQVDNKAETDHVRERLKDRDWGRKDNFPPFAYELDEWFTELPENFHDDLHTKPDVHRRWMHSMLKWGAPGTMNREDEHLWLRYLDYYVKLHELNDAQMMRVFKTLDELNVWDDTIIIFTSDHGDQVGSHGLRSKGPWNYQETMRIPLYMKIPGKTKAGTKTNALASHVDLAKTIAEFAGVTTSDYPGLVGESLSPIFDDLDAKIRDYVLFSQQWAWYQGVEHTRYASAGIFDGRYKYCRYYGVGGGADAAGVPLSGTIQFEFDSPFDDHDHEWYDLQEDPHELINLAMDRSRRNELRTRFDELRAIEEVDYAPIPS